MHLFLKIGKHFSGKGKSMPTIFIRAILIYAMMFAVLRLMGKRQISDMQPFDLANTLLIANLASLPMADTSIPLLYGVIPIIALFMIHMLVSKLSLKSEAVRTVVCGSPLIVVERGVLNEDVMRAANYNLTDLIEQLRLKDVFSIAEVEYAILETNGSLSVLPKAEYRPVTNESLGLKCGSAGPALLLAADGKAHEGALEQAGMDVKRLEAELRKLGIGSLRDCLYAMLDDNGILSAQAKAGKNASPRALSADISEKTKNNGA